MPNRYQYGRSTSNSERILAQALREADIRYVWGYKFVYGDGKEGSIDFLIENKLALEVAGVHHLNPKWNEKDNLKREHLTTKGFDYMLIPSRDVHFDTANIVKLIKSELKRKTED